jgi:CheY-like chemotaxis protein
VEDNETDALLLQTIFCKLGFLTTVCINLFMILDRVQSGMVDAMTVDIHIPGLYGVDVIRHVRETNKDVPIFAITAYTDVSIQNECLAAGATAFLTKPFTKASIVKLTDFI